MEQQVDANHVIESLLRQIAEAAQKIAVLEAMIAKINFEDSKEKE